MFNMQNFQKLHFIEISKRIIRGIYAKHGIGLSLSDKKMNGIKFNYLTFKSNIVSFCNVHHIL